jgi:flagellar L-ring protein precursor FlgH
MEPAIPASPGSLWTQQRGSLFYDTKGRNVGDIVTVAIYEKASASKEAKTSTNRSSSVSASLSKLLGLEKNIGTINSAIDPTALLDASFDNDFEGEGKTSRKEDLVATLTTQIVEVYPNGNLRITGAKTVTVNSEKQIVKLTGIVRPSDISARNVVDSQSILDARIAYTGKGVVSDKQQQGWLMRVVDNVWPF